MTCSRRGLLLAARTGRACSFARNGHAPLDVPGGLHSDPRRTRSFTSGTLGAACTMMESLPRPKDRAVNSLHYTANAELVHHGCEDWCCWFIVLTVECVSDVVRTESRGAHGSRAGRRTGVGPAWVAAAAADGLKFLFKEDPTRRERINLLSSSAAAGARAGADGAGAHPVWAEPDPSCSGTTHLPGDRAS